MRWRKRAIGCERIRRQEPHQLGDRPAGPQSAAGFRRKRSLGTLPGARRTHAASGARRSRTGGREHRLAFGRTPVDDGLHGQGIVPPHDGPPEERSHCSPYIEFLLRLPPSWAPERVCPFCEPPRSERHPLADPRTAWPFEWLARLARAPQLERTFLGPGHVVEVADEAPRELDLPLSGFYFDPGWDEAGDRAIPPLVRQGGARVEFLRVVPLHAAKLRAFRDGRGADVVRGLDAARITDLLVPDRPSCVPIVR